MTRTNSEIKNLWIAAPAVFLGVVALYAWTMPGAAGWGDGADFVLCSRFLGVAHPTGYPLTTLLGRLFMETPAGDDAFRMALLSAFAGAAAAAVFFIVAGKLSNLWIALYGAAILAVSTFLWKQAVSVEVYTINLFFFICMMWAALGKGGAQKLLVGMTGVAVLGLGNHGTLVFPAVLAALWLLSQTGRRAVSAALACCFLVVLGFTMYISIPVFSARTNIFDWNMVDGAEGLFSLVSGFDFWVIGEYRPDVMAANASALGASVFRQALPLLLAGIGFWFARRRSMPGGAVLLPGIFLMSAFFPVLYPTLEKEAFFLIAFATLLLMGCGGLAAAIENKQSVLAAIVIFAVAHVAVTGIVNYKKNGIATVSKDRTAEIFSDELFKSLRRDALLFVDHVADDTIAPPLYFQFDEYLRRDVFVFHRLYLAFSWYREYMERRAVATGDSLATPVIDMEAEKSRRYKVSREEQERLMEGKTLNTVSIDIQTTKYYEANRESRYLYVNTPARFRRSVLSENVPLAADGFAFRMGGENVRTAWPDVEASGGILDEIMFDYFTEAAYLAYKRGDVESYAQLLEKSLEYANRTWVYGELAGAYLELGDEEKARQRQKTYGENRELDDIN